MMPAHAAPDVAMPTEDTPESVAPRATAEHEADERFHILRPLGQGGQAETFLARDEQTHHQVVVKRLRLERAKDWKSVELFEREARVLAQLSHPSIPTLIHAGVEDGPNDAPSFVLVHRFVEGKTLASVIEDGVIDESQARRIARDVLEVLAYLHARRPSVVHRDIKPSNLILRPDGGVSVIDFGALQSVLRSDATVGSTIIGTPGYVAPEQMMGRAVPASDLYGLGATLLQLLSGIHPSDLPSRNMRIDFGAAVHVSSAFARFLRRLVAPSVDERFNSAAEALALLSTLPNGDTASRSSSAVDPASSPRLKVRPAYKTRVLAAVGIGSILLLAILWTTGVYELKQAHGELRIDASGRAPQDARVYVDDELVCDRMPCRARPKTGQHQIRVEATGQTPQVRDVTVGADTTTRVQFGY
jgi:serine/threonine protein kinase